MKYPLVIIFILFSNILYSAESVKIAVLIEIDYHGKSNYFTGLINKAIYDDVLSGNWKVPFLTLNEALWYDNRTGDVHKYSDSISGNPAIQIKLRNSELFTDEIKIPVDKVVLIVKLHKKMEINAEKQ